MEKLGRKTARMIVSHADESTPMRVRDIDLKADIAEKATARGSEVQERACQHCFKLSTQRFEEGTDFLKTQASLMSATATVVRVVFLVVSG